MTSSNEDHLSKGEKNSSRQQNVSSTPPNRINKNNLIIPSLAIIIALVALGITFYTLSLHNQLQQQLSHTTSNFTEEVKQLEQKQKNVLEQAETHIKNTDTLQTQFQTKFEDLNKKLQNALTQKFYQNQDWILLKARYYLELAQINAHWSNNSTSTIALLEQADKLLKQFNEPQIFTIRQIIAKDIAQIQAIPAVDIAGLLSQLDALQNSINELSIPLPGENKSTTEESKTLPNDSPWQERLQDSMNILGKLIVIRRHDQEIKPLLSPLLEDVLKEKLRLNLQEAQWAILNHDPFVYQIVLKQAINTLTTNFNENMPNTAAIIKKLTDLQQATVTQKKPSLNSALPMLNELIENKKMSLNPDINHEQGGNQQ